MFVCCRMLANWFVSDKCDLGLDLQLGQDNAGFLGFLVIESLLSTALPAMKKILLRKGRQITEAIESCLVSTSEIRSSRSRRAYSEKEPSDRDLLHRLRGKSNYGARKPIREVNINKMWHSWLQMKAGQQRKSFWIAWK